MSFLLIYLLKKVSSTNIYIKLLKVNFQLILFVVMRHFVVSKMSNTELSNIIIGFKIKKLIWLIKLTNRRIWKHIFDLMIKKKLFVFLWVVWIIWIGYNKLDHIYVDFQKKYNYEESKNIKIGKKFIDIWI